MRKNSRYTITYSKDVAVAWDIMYFVLTDIKRKCDEYSCSNCPVSWECKNLPKFDTVTITFE